MHTIRASDRETCCSSSFKPPQFLDPTPFLRFATIWLIEACSSLKPPNTKKVSRHPFPKTWKVFFWVADNDNHVSHLPKIRPTTFACTTKVFLLRTDEHVVVRNGVVTKICGCPTRVRWSFLRYFYFSVENGPDWVCGTNWSMDIFLFCLLQRSATNFSTTHNSLHFIYVNSYLIPSAFPSAYILLIPLTHPNSAFRILHLLHCLCNPVDISTGQTLLHHLKNCTCEYLHSFHNRFLECDKEIFFFSKKNKSTCTKYAFDFLLLSLCIDMKLLGKTYLLDGLKRRTTPLAYCFPCSNWTV